MVARLVYNGLIGLSVFLLVSSARFDDFADLPGPYCESIQCCRGREDSCSVPILSTLCYCDDFCNTTRVHDCCPDYWSFCRGIVTPPPPPPPPTPSPPETIKSCPPYEGFVLLLNQTKKFNCNICKCELRGDVGVLMCDEEICLVDPNIIESINKVPTYGWTASNYSEFWGRTLEDGIVLRLGTLQPQKFVMDMTPVRRIYDPNSLPKYFDSEEQWPRFISRIQDQGWCGSSWAISTAATASDRYAILSKGFEQVQLSAQNLISCDTKLQGSCHGGHLDRAWNFIKRFGLVDEDCFPYVGRNESCRIGIRGSLVAAGCRPPRFGDRKVRYTTGPAYRLGNETDIMKEITTSGPVQATIKVYQDFFYYRNGIYRHSDLALNRKQGYHSVRIVGWGEEFTSEGVEKYWKVANSWGPHWGEDGYFKIARGINECEIETFVLATWPKIDKKVLSISTNEIGP